MKDKLKKLGLELPQVSKPAASYVPVKRDGNLLYISGQLPFKDGKILHPGVLDSGILDSGVSIEQGQEAAKYCALNMLAHLDYFLKTDLTEVSFNQLTVLVASKPNFTSQHIVANGASDLLVELFGEKNGAHTRAAFGVSSLPLNASVEIAATVSVKG